MNKDTVKAAGEIFRAQNEMTNLWHAVPDCPERRQLEDQMRRVEESLRMAVVHLGGADALLNAGA